MLSHTILFQYHQYLNVKICDKEILSYIIPHSVLKPAKNKPCVHNIRKTDALHSVRVCRSTSSIPETIEHAKRLLVTLQLDSRPARIQLEQG